jgi:hypothetical protein
MISGSRARGSRQRPTDRCLWGRRTHCTCGGPSRAGGVPGHSPWPGCLVPGEGWTSALTCQNCAACGKHPGARTSPCLVRETKRALALSCGFTWWQVLGSNQRRLSRRFYRYPPTCPELQEMYVPRSFPVYSPRDAAVREPAWSGRQEACCPTIGRQQNLQQRPRPRQPAGCQPGAEWCGLKTWAARIRRFCRVSPL